MVEVHRFCIAAARSLRPWLCVAVVLILPSRFAAAQDVPFTLHVYTSLFQIPTLVLDRRMQLPPPIDAQRFKVRIDSKRPFAPRHVRLEGEDPISLAVLIDASGGQNSLMPSIADVIATFAQEDLREQDHVYLYAIDCSLVYALHELPAGSEKMNAGVTAVLSSATLHKAADPHTSCRSKPLFYDAARTVIYAMRNTPGRRVLLAISDGFDGGSKFNNLDVGAVAISYGVTIFGLNAGESFMDISQTRAKFGPLCNHTGGMVLSTDPKHVRADIKQFISLVRGRYIIEFQRPEDMSRGNHTISVSVNKLEANIWPAGTSAPIGDPKSDTDIEHAPPPGEHRKKLPVPAPTQPH